MKKSDIKEMTAKGKQLSKATRMMGKAMPKSKALSKMCK